MEELLLEYLVNSLWQLPLLAAGAWVVVRVGRPGPRMQHRVWVTALFVAVLLPAGGLVRRQRTELISQRAERVVATSSREATSLDNGLTAETAPLPLSSAEEPRIGRPVAAIHTLPQWRLGASATRWVVGVYLAVIALFALRLLAGWVTGRRLVRASCPVELSTGEEALLARCCGRLQVARPEVRVSATVWSPLVVGIVRPVLMLPEGLIDRGDEAELEAVWWHELTHIRRRDSLANLLCRVWALPVAYHPAGQAIARRVQRTREMVCDAEAAAQMDSPVSYARCLMKLAERMKLPTAVGLEGTAMFGDGALEERVMELLRTKAKVSGRGRVLRNAACVAACGLVAASAGMFHVTPTLAKVRAQASEPVGPTVPATPDAAIPPAASGSPAAALTHASPIAPPAPAAPVNSAAPIVAEPVRASFAASSAERQKALAEAMGYELSPELQEQIAHNMALAESVLNSAETQKRIVELNSPEFAKQMAEMKKNLKEAMETQDRVSAIYRLKLGRTVDAPDLMLSPEFQKQMDVLKRQLYVGDRTVGYLTQNIFELKPGEAGQMPDQKLYGRAMGAAASKQYDVERALLQALLKEYPESKYAAEAKKAIAESWDAQGTLALVQAEEAYAAAGVKATPLGSGVTPPALIRSVEPEYTPEARAAKLHGTVVVSLWVDEQGNVQHVRVVRGLGSGLDEKAIDAVRQYKFKPALQDGKPVMVSLNVEVDFRMF